MEKESKEVREHLSFIGRYMESISPKLEKYKELAKQKTELRKKLFDLGKKKHEKH